MPKYIDDWINDLLRECLLFNPQARPSSKEILKIHLANSINCRKYEAIRINKEVQQGIINI